MISQCGRTPVGARGVPHAFTMTLWASPPSGTSGSVTLGISSNT